MVMRGWFATHPMYFEIRYLCWAALTEAQSKTYRWERLGCGSYPTLCFEVAIYDFGNHLHRILRKIVTCGRLEL